MKKLMCIVAVGAVAGMLAGCGSFSSESVKINKSQYVCNGQVKSFTPDTPLGGYLVGVTLGKDVTDKVFTNAVQAQAFTGKAFLLVGMDETAAK